MQIQSNCHTHTQFCDGRNTAEEMVESALRNGFYSLGFTPHATQLFDNRCNMAPEREKLYRQEILRLREKYRDRIKIVMGIERGIFSVCDVQDYEYYIASVHYLPTLKGFVAVDGKAQAVFDYVKYELGGDGLLFARKYFELLSAYARSFHPPIIGHFDLVRKNNARLQLYDESSPAYRDLALQALHAIRETGAMLEVNTGAIARGYLPSPYPDEYALKYWAMLGGEVIVSSDCHDAVNIACQFEQMPAFLKKCGFDHVVQLSRGEELFERLPL